MRSLLLVTKAIFILAGSHTSASNHLASFLLSAINTFNPKNVYLHLDQADMGKNLQTCHKLHKFLWFVETILSEKNLSTALSLEANYPNRQGFILEKGEMGDKIMIPT